MTISKLPRARGIKLRKFTEVIVAEGDGTEQDPVREVHYFYDEEGKLIFRDGWKIYDLS
jgi:hypothetical protein